MRQLPEEEEYVLKKMTPFHCKRGKDACDECLNLYLKGEKFCILHVPDRPGLFARPITEIEIDGQQYFVEFEFYKTFDTRQEAIDAAKDLKVIYTELE
jgi:hypothetical protein